MTDFLKKNKGTVVFIAVLALLVIAYIYWRSRPEDAAQPVDQDVVQNVAIGQEILALQDRIRSIRLDESIFINKTFQRLTDNSLVILNEPTGRENPFAELTLDSVDDIQVARFVDVITFPEPQDVSNEITATDSVATTSDNVATTSSETSTE